MKYVFGPVSSRRLGKSLGIDPVPLKVCNWDCVYCQLGRTRARIDQRQDFYPPEDILAEVRMAIRNIPPGSFDWLTFVGSGETTLCASLGWLVKSVGELTQAPIAVITNGSLLYLPEVRRALLGADLVIPGLDAGSETLYRKINQPCSTISLDQVVEGLVTFRQEFQGELWLEVMLVRDMNDSEQALRDLAALIQRISPHVIHLNLPTRPPAEAWVQPPEIEGLFRAAAILGENTQVVRAATGSFQIERSEDVVDALLGILARHPMRQDELDRLLGQWVPGQERHTMQSLVSTGRLQQVHRYGRNFWTASPARYGPASEGEDSMGRSGKI